MVRESLNGNRDDQKAANSHEPNCATFPTALPTRTKKPSPTAGPDWAQRCAPLEGRQGKTSERRHWISIRRGVLFSVFGTPIVRTPSS